MNMHELSAAITDEIHAAEGKVSLIFKDFDTGISFRYAPQSEMIAGDMAKIAILLAALCGIEEGRFTLENCLVVPELWVNYDSAAFDRGTMSYSIDELLAWMIVANEDTAANALIEVMGYNYINQCCYRRGMDSTRVICRLGQTKVQEDPRFNTTIAQDILTFFEGLYRNTLFSRPLCEYAGRLFLRHRDNGGLTRYICDDIYTGRLVSDKDTVNHEAGVFYLQNVDYFLGIFNSNSDQTPETRLASQRMRGRIADMIYNYYLEHQPQVEG